MRHVPSTILILALLFWGMGCATETLVTSRPNDARVIMDENKDLGPTPFVLREDVWVWTDHSLTFSKPGYETRRISVEASLIPTYLFVCAISGCISWAFWPIAFFGRYPNETVGVVLDPKAPLGVAGPQTSIDSESIDSPLSPITFSSHSESSHETSSLSQ